MSSVFLMPNPFVNVVTERQTASQSVTLFFFPVFWQHLSYPAWQASEGEGKRKDERGSSSRAHFDFPP